jgi:hypothetical protein
VANAHDLFLFLSLYAGKVMGDTVKARKRKTTMYVPVDDVEVHIQDWETADLIAEIRERASQNDKEARKFLGSAPDEEDEPLSSAAALSRLTAHATPEMLRAVMWGIPAKEALGFVAAWRALGFSPVSP